jgi:hypothetical protein
MHIYIYIYIYMTNVFIYSIEIRLTMFHQMFVPIVPYNKIKYTFCEFYIRAWIVRVCDFMFPFTN